MLVVLYESVELEAIYFSRASPWMLVQYQRSWSAYPLIDQG